MPTRMLVAVYTPISTTDQNSENQPAGLRRYADARGGTITREIRDLFRELRPRLELLPVA
jgi:DNA invertase Pin-like site-specific DNA recombinase